MDIGSAHTGLQLRASTSIPLETRAAIYAASKSGTPVVSFLEEYD